MIMIIVIAIGSLFGSGCQGTNSIDDDATTNRVFTAATTNRILWLNNIGASIAIIALLLLSLKLKCPEDKSVVLSLPFVLWHRWGWEHILMMIGDKAISTTRH